MHVAPALCATILLAALCAVLGATAAALDAVLDARKHLLELLITADPPSAKVVSEVRRVQERARLVGDTALLSLALSVECRALYRSGDMAAADLACQEALRRAPEADDLAAFAASRMTGTLIVERGKPMEALPYMLDSQAAARRSGDELAVAAALGTLGSTAQFAGANADAFAYYDQAVSLATRINAHGLRYQLSNNLGVLLLESGDAEGARTSFEAAIEAASRLPGPTHGDVSARYGLALARVEGGSAAEAEAAVAELRSLVALPHPQQTAAQRAEAEIYMARAEFRLGRYQAAETAVLAALDALGSSRRMRAYPAQALLLDVLVAQGRLDEAEKLGERLISEIPQDARGRVELLEARMRLLAARGSYPKAYQAALDAQRARADQARLRSSGTMAFIRARAAAQERSRELTALRAEQTSARNAAQQARTVRNLLTALVALVLLGAVVMWRKTLAQRRLEAEVERRRSIDALGLLAGGVAHDFNNLMTIVQQGMGLLRRDPAVRVSGQALGLIDEADDAARVCGRITQQLLAFAKQQPMVSEDVCVREHLERARVLFERALGKAMHLSCDVQDEHCRVRVNPGQLTAALINLLANARDAMHDQGEVTLRVESLACGGLALRWPGLAKGRYVAISVIDRGRGMSAEVAQLASTPFFTTKGSSGGTGLGLSTVHGFAAQSGGILKLDSTPGTGTTMSLVLPQVAPAPA